MSQTWPKCHKFDQTKYCIKRNPEYSIIVLISDKHTQLTLFLSHMTEKLINALFYPIFKVFHQVGSVVRVPFPHPENTLLHLNGLSAFIMSSLFGNEVSQNMNQNDKGTFAKCYQNFGVCLWHFWLISWSNIDYQRWSQSLRLISCCKVPWSGPLFLCSFIHSFIHSFIPTLFL